jgi:hypothetical protein
MRSVSGNVATEFSKPYYLSHLLRAGSSSAGVRDDNNKSIVHAKQGGTEGTALFFPKPKS